MPKPIQLKKLLLLMLLFSSSTNVFSQTIKNYIDNQWQNSRYINNGDETVTDTKTALMWKQCSEGLRGSDCLTVVTGAAEKYTYKEAIELAKNTTFATYSDWRLPNMKELGSLAARDRYNPTINIKFFPNTPNFTFGSSSPYADNDDFVWALGFSYGKDNYSSRNFPHYVRLVRGGY